jgi:hypothetical protein
MDEKEEKIWRRFKEVMHYSDEQLEKFKSNPRFVKMVNTPEYRNKKIIAEVVQSHGCVCRHEVGQRIVLTGNAALISAECPALMCIGLVSQLRGVTPALFERMAAGLDPNGLLIDTVGCVDVGVDCGGWGRVLVKIHVEDRDKK